MSKMHITSSSEDDDGGDDDDHPNCDEETYRKRILDIEEYEPLRL